MDELTSLLQNARKENDISLEHISEKTKIQIKLLQELENGNYSAFAGEIYVKGAIRAYAKEVGVDPDKAVELYTQWKQPQSKDNLTDEPQKESLEKRERNIKNLKVNKKQAKSAEIKNLNTAVYVIIFTVLFLLLFGVVLLLLGNGNAIIGIDDNDLEEEAPEVVEELPDTQEEPEEKEDEEEELEAEEEVEDVEKPELELIESNDSETVWNFKGEEEMELLLEFEGNCWTHIMADNEELHSETFSSGDKVNVEAEERIRVRLGAPPQVIMFINEIEIENLDEKNRPHNYIFEHAENSS